MKKLWDQAKIQFHNVREMDRDRGALGQPFRCFTCDCWFERGVQLDRNYNFISSEIELCPIAQVDLFNP